MNISAPSPFLYFSRSAQLARIPVLAVALTLFSGCVSGHHHRTARVTVVERSAPPPPSRTFVMHEPHQPSVVIVRETPLPFARVIIVDRKGPPPPAHAIVIHTPPPPLQAEVKIARPSHRHVWCAGHWRYQGGRYVWVAGRWDLPPKPHAIYKAPHWETRGGSHVFIEGHWRS